MSDEKNLETNAPEPTEAGEELQAAAEQTAETVAEAVEETQETVEAAVEAPAVEEEDDLTPEDNTIEIEEEEAEPVSHDDFDWTVGKRDTTQYTAEETKHFTELYSTSLNTVIEHELVQGKVTSITNSDIVLDINFKSDGLVSKSEFRDMPDLAVGDVIEVYVEEQEDKRGQLRLSRRKAKILRAWDDICKSYEEGKVIKGTIVSKTKGGLIADVGGLETFLPGSQIDVKPITDYDQFVGREMEFKVVKINEKIKNAVVSHKILIEKDLEAQRQEIIKDLDKGQVLEGVVKNITDFGAFLDLGGVDGLLYITDISWGRVKHPSDVLEINDRLNVVVLDFDDNKKRISLGLKQLQPHPWDSLGEEIKEGSTVKGKVVNVEDYGAFIEIMPGVEGLVHISEVSWSNQPINAHKFFTKGEEHEAKVVTLDKEDRKMSLSIKQLLADPWETIAQKFPVESQHKGLVKNLTPYGVFVELEEGIGGMVHISDLSWTKRYSHPSEFTKVGEEIDITILDIDNENRKLSLGHKQLEENPWDTFETVFPEGSYHEATIVRKDDRGAIVQLPYGLEAFAPIRHLRKEDGNPANVDETLQFKVLEFNRDDKRILVSHTRYLQDMNKEVKEGERKERRQEKDRVRKAVKNTNTKVERTTLGDLADLSDLRDQLKGEE